MADLAGVIQRGTAAQGSMGPQLASQAASIQQGASQKVASGVAIERNALQDRQLTMQEEAMQMQMQGMIDSKNDVLFMGMENLQKQAAAAQKAMEDLPTSLPEGTDVTTPISRGMLAKMAGERQKAETAYQAQIDKRNDYVLNIMRSPQAVAMLKKGSLADNYIAEKLLSPEIFESMNPAEQEEVIARVTAMREIETQAQSEQAQIQLQSRYANTYAEESAKANAKGIDTEYPSASFWGVDAYTSRVNSHIDASLASGLPLVSEKNKWTEAEGARYHGTDIVPILGQAKPLSVMPESDKASLRTLFSLWDPEDTVAFDTQLEKLVNSGLSTDVGNDVLAIINGVEGGGSHAQSRIGEIINITKRYLPPKIQRRTLPGSGD